jgi:outer membrane protein
LSNAATVEAPASGHPRMTGPSWIQRHAISLVVAILLASFAPRAFAQVRIAVVDLQRALQETEDGRRAKARLKRLFKQRQEDLDKRQTELKQLSEELEQQSKVLSSDARQERVEDLQKKALELQQLYVQYQRELAEKEAELTSQIIGRMEQILRRIGQTEGYTLIVERSEGGVVWMPSNLDLTDVVIQRYNSGEGREAGDGAAGGGGAAAGGGGGGAGAGSGGAGSGGAGGGGAGGGRAGGGAGRATKAGGGG